MHSSRSASLARALWRDEAGTMGGADYILALTILVIGGVAGLVAVRDAMVQNLGDVAVALELIDQSYTVNYTVNSGTVVSFSYADPPLDPALQDLELQAPYGIFLCADDADGGGDEN